MRKIKPRAVAVAALLATVAVAWHASLRKPVGPAAGTEIEGNYLRDAAGQSSTLRVATFNIHGCKGRDGRRDVNRVAECLNDLDFVVLNEVHGSAFCVPVSQAEMLAQKLGMAWLDAPAESRWYGAKHFGNAVLTSLPVRYWQRIPLPHRWDHSFRNVLLVNLDHGGRAIHVLATHVVRSDERERRSQLRAVAELFLALGEPSLLVGDLNSGADDPCMEELLAAPGVIDAVGQVLGPQAPPRIDWILARGFRAKDAGIRDNGASDHPMIWVELEFKSDGRLE
jgi:endonuclease/exonuclease/phosphatase family metal-dependent hydrolase